MEWGSVYQTHCEGLKRSGNYRRLPISRSLKNIQYDFSSNDYLQLSKDSEVIQAGINALVQWGAGATGSRLLSGNHTLYEAFETQIAMDKQMDRALLFNSGYQANLSVLAALLNRALFLKPPLVFFDRLNHASLYQGVFLSGATLIRYRHLDMDHLAELLNQYRLETCAKFIVTETLFGMDGDVVPMEKILQLTQEHHAFLYLDEAHAVGILGSEGYGLSTTVLHDVPMLVMGTLSKAIGCSGAYVASQEGVIEYLINKANGFMFSTALSPTVLASAFVAWKKIKTMEADRVRLMQLSQWFREQLRQEGFDLGGSTTHIMPLILGSNEKIQAYDQALKEVGIEVSLIRRPTVPPKGERLRFACHVGHRKEALEDVIAKVIDIKKNM